MYQLLLCTTFSVKLSVFICQRTQPLCNQLIGKNCVNFTTFTMWREKKWPLLDLLCNAAASRECCHTLLGQKKISPNPPLISWYPSLPSKTGQNDCWNMKALVGFGTWNGIYFSLYVSTVGGEFGEKICRKEDFQYFSFLFQLYDVTRNAKWYSGHFSSLNL